jgi:hypothetical protein
MPNAHVCKPVFARWSTEYLPGRGWRLVDPDGTPSAAIYATRDGAMTACDLAQARTDAAVQKRTRPCMCCRDPFDSEGIHNRLCTRCRSREADNWNPYGLAPRSGRAK